MAWSRGAEAEAQRVPGSPETGPAWVPVAQLGLNLQPLSTHLRSGLLPCSKGIQMTKDWHQVRKGRDLLAEAEWALSSRATIYSFVADTFAGK